MLLATLNAFCSELEKIAWMDAPGWKEDEERRNTRQLARDKRRKQWLSDPPCGKPTLCEKLEKRAASLYDEMAAEHHRAPTKDWALFEKNLRTAKFQKAVLAHPESVDKLREYVKNVGGYLRAKNTVGKVLSRSNPGSVHRIKELPSGRLGCGCKDWQYSHSVKGSDCAHVKAFKES